MATYLFYTSQPSGRTHGPQIAATLAQNNYGGTGFALGGVPGIPPADVVILGAGTVGRSAARAFLGLGANVHMLDSSLKHFSISMRNFQAGSTPWFPIPSISKSLLLRRCICGRSPGSRSTLP